MSHLNVLARASALAIMTLACFAGLTLQVYAQDEQTTSRQFSAKAGETVLKAQTLMTQSKFSAALAELQQASDLTDLTPYETSIIAQMQGNSFYQSNQYGLAISAFERAIAAGGLLPKEADDMSVQVAQLMIGNGQIRAGAERLEAHIQRSGDSNPKYIELLSQAWMQEQEYARALPWAEKVLAAANPKTRKHYDMMNALYFHLKDTGRQAQLVKEMIKRWPEERELWEAWASLLSQSGRDQDAFEVNKLLYIRGALTQETDILKIVQYYSYYDMPYQAAQILEKEMNAGRVSRETDKLVQLATLYRQAREYARAIPVLEAATQTGGTGDLFAQLGEALYNEGNCGRAETAFTQAIDRGYDAGKAWMLIATCRYEDAQSQEKLNCEMNEAEKSAAPKTKARQSAIAAFENVPPSSMQNSAAKKWVSFIKAERETFDRRCAFEVERKELGCYQDIKRAYNAFFLTGEFVLDDAECEAFIPAYDKEYRSKSAG